MAAITFQVNFTGNPDEMDDAAAQYIVDVANARLAAEDPPGTPLPDGNPGQLKASYLSELEAIVLRAHESYTRAVREKEITNPDGVKAKWKAATNAQRAAALAALS